MEKCELSYIPIPWMEFVPQMVANCLRKDFKSTIRKLSFSMTIYSIWTERSSRFYLGANNERPTRQGGTNKSKQPTRSGAKQEKGIR